MSVDLELFVEQTTWLAPHLDDPSRFGVLTWLGRRLQPEARRRFAAHFPLSHPAQRRAEAGVCSLLGRSLVVHSPRLVKSDDVTRRTDWGETYARASVPMRPPMPFLTRERIAVPDRASLGALVSLARAWARCLELADTEDGPGREYQARRQALGRAVAPQLVRGLTPAPYGRRHSILLRRLDDRAAADVQSIEHALGFWSRTFSPSTPGDAETLVTLSRLLGDADAQNIDTLMEATVAISIARAAIEADRPDWPTLFPWSLVEVDDPRSMYPVILLRSGDLMCEISKGTPQGGVSGSAREKIADQLSPWADEALPATGRARSSGRQPDLVVSFWFEGDPSKVVFALGDAKRNATGDGEGYIRAALEVAATYLMSFGYRMGLNHPGRHGGPYRTDLMPGVTLFCRQGTGRDAKAVIDQLRRDAGPVVMAFDLEQHMEPGSRPWRAPVLAAWLGSLGRQAVRALGEPPKRRRRR